MKIVFLCGSLEPGLDGVGDYTRKLGGELIRQGHQVAALALNDRCLTTDFQGVQQTAGGALPVLRLPSAMSEKKRMQLARDWVDAFDPQWLSLQYVPFSFQLKGLPFGLSSMLAKLGHNRHWHIMFHELWLGMEEESSLKQWCWGWTQKQLIRSLILRLQPAVMHTQTQLYQLQLARLGFSVDFLPLFANIPATERSDEKAEEGQLNAGEEYPGSRVPLSLVHFGTIQKGVPVESFARELALYSREKETPVKLVFIGRCGQEQFHWAKVWEEVGIQADFTGMQSPESISEMMRSARIGISTTPLAQIEKSGSFAAMRAHGLPVLCVARPWKPRGIQKFPPPLGVMEYDSGNLEAALGMKTIFALTPEVSDVSRRLTHEFSAVGKGTLSINSRWQIGVRWL